MLKIMLETFFFLTSIRLPTMTFLARQSNGQQYNPWVEQVNPNSQHFDSFQSHNSNRDNRGNNEDQQSKRKNDRIQRKIDNRRLQLDSMPENTCSFISSFDLLKDAVWLQSVNVWTDASPTIIPLLQKNNYSKAKLSDALQQLKIDSLKFTKTQLQNIQDPWIIIETLRLTLLNFDVSSNIIPLVKLEKCQPQCPHILGDINYIYTKGKCQIEQMTCSRCQNKSLPTPVYTPANFYVRLKGNRNNAFMENGAPIFQIIDQRHTFNSIVQLTILERFASKMDNAQQKMATPFESASPTTLK